MTLFSTICGEQYQGPLTENGLDLSPCFRETVLDATIPLLFALIALIYQLSRKFSKSHEYKPVGEEKLPNLPNRWKQPLPQLVQSVFVLLTMGQYTFLFAWRLRDFVSSDQAPIYLVLDPILSFAAWTYIFLLLSSTVFSTYKGGVSNANRHHILILLFYTLTFSVSWIRLRSAILETTSGVEKVLAPVYTVFCTVLWLISVLQPQDIDPRNFVLVDDETLEISEDGKIIKNGLELSPETWASVYSWSVFEWMTPLVIFGNKQPLSREDIYTLSVQHRARWNFMDFQDTLKSTPSYKVLKRMILASWDSVLIQLVVSNITVAVSYTVPYFLQKFLEYLENPNGRPVSVAYFYVFMMFLNSILKMLIATVHLFYGRRWNIRAFNQLDAEIFYKTLKRKDVAGKVEAAKKEKKESEEEEDVGSISNVGKITNLMSVDADRLGIIPSFVNMFYNSPVEIFIALFYLYKLLGVAALVGLVIMLVSFPITGWLSVKLNKVYTTLMAAKDKRNELTNELLQGIRMVKFFAWEKTWTQKVNDARAVEIKHLWRVVTYSILFEALYMITPTLVTIATFMWYTKIAKQELTASVAFVAITLFDMLRNPLLLLPDAFSTFSEAYASLTRISDYLKEEEVKLAVIDDSEYMDESGKPQYEKITRTGFENASFQWHIPLPEETQKKKDTVETDADAVSEEAQAPPFTLRIPELDFPVGEIAIVCGPTGSGKTSLLYALLGEMDCVDGRVHLPSKLRNSENFSMYPQVDPKYPELKITDVAFVSQTSFLQHASIRDNILFGEKFEETRYKKVLRQCALVKDLSVLPDGDRTEIGEKGISLSGGQKQRVALARAVYSHAKTVLLDDCLSAVDSHTAKHLYFKCLLGDLMVGRTVILVTHHVKLCLPHAKYIVKLENGSVSGSGYVKDLRDRKILQNMVGEDDSAENAQEADAIEETGAEEEEEDIDLGETKEEAKKLIKEEASEVGSVKFRVYKAYFDACGGWIFWSSVIAAFILSRLLVIVQSYWIRVWAAAYQEADSSFTMDYYQSTLHTQNDLPLYYTPLKFANYIAQSAPTNAVLRPWIANKGEPVNVDYYIAVYALLCFVFLVIDVGKAILTYRGSVSGAQVLFHKMLDRIVHAPMRFFDTTPVGRILNRFGKDVATIDTQMARNALVLFECITMVIAAAVVMISVTPMFIIACLLVSVLYIMIGKLYLQVSREFKRLNSVSRSPIYSHFSETLVGVSTIRAYGAQERFMREMLFRLDTYTSSFYLLWMSNRWLYCRIELTGALVTLAAGVFIVLKIGTIDAGLAGLSLTFSRGFLEGVYWFVRQYTQVEMNLNSVERVQEYLEIEQEPPYIIEGHEPSAAWPTTAAVEIKDLSISYAADLDPVIKNVSFDILPHEKVGVVGRTGSGKSTLALSLFRFVDPTTGHIKIDGIDITHIGVESLRSKLTIIPQDAVLFSGTIRSNLDPLEIHSDEAIWDILTRVHLVNQSPSSTPHEGSTIGSIDNVDSATATEEENNKGISSLDAPVSDGGQNFSQGQRQLLCMARALLRDSRLIIMDEATASVDYETDRKIQITIREEFSESTLICIAHRLRTIIDYDRVLVLDQGSVAEYDTPYNLLCKGAGTGMFKAMCEKSGEIDTLIQMATTAENKRVADREQGIITDVSPDDFSRLH